ncbi:hypothetical protein [Burkholderia semiarida]|uniref:hypothetical protein n=1 Tax=Burkholderia semiarida TaxID=2843303 RepID=UPI0038783D50
MQGRYINSVKAAYLGNQIAVQFFSMAVPVILKARHASVVTLPMFASLSLMWCLRCAIVPPLLRFIAKTAPLRRSVALLLCMRVAIVAIFIGTALVTISISSFADLERILFVAGVAVCLLSGIERGLIDASAMLEARAHAQLECARASLYEAFGVLLASTLTGGVLLALCARYGIPSVLLTTAALLAALAMPICVDMSIGSHRPGDGESSAPIPALSDTRRLGTLETGYYVVVIALGWLGIDLAFRVTQPLLLSQGVTLARVGLSTVGIGIAVLCILAAGQIVPALRIFTCRHLESISGLLSALSVVLLTGASVSGNPLVTVAGFMALKCGYFFFSAFATDTVIETGSTTGSIGAMVCASGLSYLASHFAVVPILYWTTSHFSGYTVACGTSVLFVTSCMIGTRFLARRFRTRPAAPI